MANKTNPILKMLRPGDLRMKGASEDVVARIEKKPDQFPLLMACLEAQEPALVMRAFDALEKLSRRHPDWLSPYRSTLLNLCGTLTQKEARWHLAQIVPRLPLTAAQRKKAYGIFQTYLDSKSSIVKTFAMQAMVDLALQTPDLHAQTKSLVQNLEKMGTPAMKSRSRKLLVQLS